MKHQGKYGFTYDSKAEEWEAWAWSCVGHNPPRSYQDLKRLTSMACEYSNEAAMDLTRIPINAQHATSLPTSRTTWPLTAAAIALIVGAGVALWVWG